MASVRLTIALHESIIRSVRNDFTAVMEGYSFSKELANEVEEFARAELAKANAQMKSITADVLGAVTPIVKGYGGNIGERSARDLRDALTGSAYEYQAFYVQCADPESDTGETVNIFTSAYPFNNMSNAERMVPKWHPLAKEATSVTSDQGLVAKILPLFLKRRALEVSKRLAVEYAENMMSGCNTLAQLVRKWPDVINVVPQDAINKMNDKTQAAMPAPQPEPDAIMGMDDALKSIRLQAEAVKALR